MNSQIRTIRISIIIIFILITIGTFLSSIYLVWITAFGIGWGGNKMSLIELIWMWKGIILISIYLLISSVGLAKKKKFGVIFGYAITLGFLANFFISFITYERSSEIPFTLSDFFLLLLIFFLPVLIIVGLVRIKKSFSEFKLSDYIISGILTIILFLSFYFRFE